MRPLREQGQEVSGRPEYADASRGIDRAAFLGIILWSQLSGTGMANWEIKESIADRGSPAIPAGAVDLPPSSFILPPSFSARPFRIGNVAIDFPVVQAALSGYSDWPMRVIARRLGAAYTLGEVLLDRFIVQVSKGSKARRYIRTTQRGAPRRRN